MFKIPQVRTGQVGKAVAKTPASAPKRIQLIKGRRPPNKPAISPLSKPVPKVAATVPAAPKPLVKPTNKMPVRREPIKSVGTKLSRLARR